MDIFQELTLGARYLGAGRCAFRVWAPNAATVDLLLDERVLAMEPEEYGYFTATADGVALGARYRYRLDGTIERADPASRWQPDDVHGPSAVVDPAFPWSDAGWQGVPLEAYIIYELHLGTFTPEGTFDAAIGRLPYLQELGITAVEIMPVAQFPGGRNWGYDGTYPYAPQQTYGGPEGLRRLVDACHAAGISVVLDVVYNHLGPEGNYLRDFGPYFTDRYRTLWGEGLNLDGPDGDEVRRFFIENALYWLHEFHIDAFRLDAIDAVVDESARHFVAELVGEVHAAGERLGRRAYLIGELGNNPRYIRDLSVGGYGLDSQWADELHHSIHTQLTGERNGYYIGYGEFEHLGRALSQGYVYTGQYSPHRRRRYGDSTHGLPGSKFVVCTQNHDQVGNRAFGERLATLVSFPATQLAAGVVLLSPFIPLLWMGEEYGETAPFLYFISHGDQGLVEAVRQGRRKEFAAFFAGRHEPPDPAAEETFLSSKINPELRHSGSHKALFALYKELLRLRREHPVLRMLSKNHQEIVTIDGERVLLARRWNDDGQQVASVFSFADTPQQVRLPLPEGRWQKLLASYEPAWRGDDAEAGSAPAVLVSGGEVTIKVPPLSFAVYEC